MPPATRAVFLEEIGMVPGDTLSNHGPGGTSAGSGGLLDEDEVQGFEDISHAGEDVRSVFECMS